VCAFNSGGVPYTVVDGETGFLTEENDYEGMADNIEKLIVEPELRKKMSLAARKFVEEHYSLEKSASEMAAVYKMLIS
jgi:colanic acid/amylovoran biosynthesis glycosyltransferase